MAYSQEKYNLRNASSIAGVVLVHAAIGYAFISGLAYRVITELPPVFEVRSIPDDVTPPPLPKDQPPPKSERVTTSDQVVVVTRAQDQIIVPPDPPFFTPTTEKPRIDPLPPPQPSLASGPRVRGKRMSWITTEDYPSASIRNNEEGTVAIAVRVGADGRVSSCEVTGSSGYPALDAVTCRLYARRARFEPALDADGVAVAATYSDRVRWQLPRE